MQSLEFQNPSSLATFTVEAGIKSTASNTPNRWPPQAAGLASYGQLPSFILRTNVVTVCGDKSSHCDLGKEPLRIFMQTLTAITVQALLPLRPSKRDGHTPLGNFSVKFHAVTLHHLMQLFRNVDRSTRS